MVRNHEVRGSIPLFSTKKMPKAIENKGLSVFFWLNTMRGIEPARARPSGESPVDFRAGSGPSLLNGQAKGGSCDEGADANPPILHHNLSENVEISGMKSIGTPMLFCFFETQSLESGAS